MTGDSVEARDVMAHTLCVRQGHTTRKNDPYCSESGEWVDAQLAALFEHGYSVIRTDPETMNAAIAAALHANHFSGSAPALEAALVESVVLAALVVLRGDPQ